MFPTVKIIAGKGTSGQAAPGQDYLSGMVFYCTNGTLPSGFTTVARTKQLFSLSDAIAAGINNTYSDETKATMTASVTTPATDGGNTITVNWNDPILGIVNLCTYVTKAADLSDTLLAASIAAAINANTANSGFTAISAVALMTVTPPAGLGIYPNANYANLTFTITGTDAGGNAVIGAVALGVTGVPSQLAIWYYHIVEYFRLNVNTSLWVGFFATPANAAAYTFAEVATLQSAAGGTLRQIGIYAPKTYAASAADTIAWINEATGLLQAQYAALLLLKQPVQLLFGTDLFHLTNISALVNDLSTQANNRVSVIISQDGANLGNNLWLTTGYSITTIGAVLGVLSLSAVSDDIGDLGQFNMTSGTELSVPAFATGELVKSLAASLIVQLDLYRYVFMTTYQGYSGTYINNDHTATAYTDQFSYIHFGRTWDKAARQLYIAYLPYLKAKFALAANGQLSPTTQAVLQQAGQMALDPMVQAQDLSGYSVAVPANQNPNTSGKLNVTVHLLAMAIANEIDITSTFVASLP